jgi:hypothetical protein
MQPFRLLAWVAVGFFLTACPYHAPVRTPLAITAVTALSAAADLSEGTTPVSAAQVARRESRWALWDWVLPEASAGGVCPAIKTAVCSGNTITFIYNNCVFLRPNGTLDDVIYGGGSTLTFGGGATCSTTPTSNSSGTMSWMFANKSYRISVDTAVEVINTANPSGFNGPVSGGITTTFTDAIGGRKILLDGLELTELTGLGQLLSDRSISSTDFTITGTGATRTISGGTFTEQHNNVGIVATATLTSSLTFTAKCCVPTGGQVKTSFVGTNTGSETLTFESTCGAATLIDSNGHSRAVKVPPCL